MHTVPAPQAIDPTLVVIMSPALLAHRARAWIAWVRAEKEAQDRARAFICAHLQWAMFAFLLYQTDIATWL